MKNVTSAFVSGYERVEDNVRKLSSEEICTVDLHMTGI